MDPEYKRHDQCPCVECGLTPERWQMMVQPSIVRIEHEMREAGIPPEADPDDLPLQLPQPGELGVPIMEARLNGNRPNRYKLWDGVKADYVDGDPRGPGRGELSPAWVEWALDPDTLWR